MAACVAYRAQAVVWGWRSLKLHVPRLNHGMAFYEASNTQAVTGGRLSTCSFVPQAVILG
jgi:hypothetical protein